MIERLSIHGLGVIEDAEFELGPGLTAVTGETGAGKTMVVSALGLLLGARADGRLAGASRVTGVWRSADPWLADAVESLGGELDGDELFLSRVVTEAGRSRAAVGGVPVPVHALRELGERLVTVHGQQDQMRLQSARQQRAALDAFGGPPLAALLKRYRVAFEAWRGARSERDRAAEEAALTAQQRERLEYVVEQIGRVAPEPGEDVRVRERLEVLRNADGLREAVRAALAALRGADGSDGADAVSLIGRAESELARSPGADRELASLAERLAELSYQASDLGNELAGYLAGFDEDGARELAALEERWALLADLQRGYGPTLEDAIGAWHDAEERLSRLEVVGDELARLDARVAELAAQLTERAAALTDARREAAGRLSAGVAAELDALAMPGAELIVEVEPAGEPGPDGADRVAFLLRPHPSAKPGPLGKTASGGELSRVMLAIEVVLAERAPTPTMVFDEVDAGVGGATAVEIGRRLVRLSRRCQVIVVTHLAQVAAFADLQIRVLKDASGGVTSSTVRELDGAGRRAEIARMLSGREDSVTGLAHADELLGDAAEYRRRV